MRHILGRLADGTVIESVIVDGRVDGGQGVDGVEGVDGVDLVHRYRVCGGRCDGEEYGSLGELGRRLSAAGLGIR